MRKPLSLVSRYLLLEPKLLLLLLQSLVLWGQNRLVVLRDCQQIQHPRRLLPVIFLIDNNYVDCGMLCQSFAFHPLWASGFIIMHMQFSVPTISAVIFQLFLVFLCLCCPSYGLPMDYVIVLSVRVCIRTCMCTCMPGRGIL